jgi:prolyl oligopeptidase
MKFAKLAHTVLATWVAVSASAASSATQTPQAPPPAPSQPVTQTYHGVTVVDPYRNLEDVKSPPTANWLNAQAAYAAEQLSRIPGRDAMTQRVQALSRESGDAVRRVMRMPGERIYYLKRRVGDNQFKLLMRTGLNGAEQVLVDPDVLTQATGAPHAINYFMPSWDGKTLAYGLSGGGSEDASLYLMDVASGKQIGAPIPRVHEGQIHWSPDSQQLTYNQVRQLPAGAPDSETFLDSTVFVLTKGQAASEAKAIFGPLVNKELKLARLDVGEVMFDPQGSYMLARTTDTTVPEGGLFVAPVSALKDASIAWRQIASAADKITDIQMRGDMLYLRTYAGAPRGRVLVLSLKEPVLAKAVEVVAEPQEGVLKSFALGADAVFAEVRKGFSTRVLRHVLDIPLATAKPGVDVAAALAGSVFIVSEPAHAARDAWLYSSSWTDVPRILTARADGTVQDTGLLVRKRPSGDLALEVSEVMVPSHDGVKVPLAIIHRKGLKLNGNNPTLLVGYGAYGFSIEAGFDPGRLAWLERDGVLAYANVRGSGAFGDPWYRAGFKATKPNTWLDGVACARYLIAQKYTSPSTLGIWGTSAGGIFVGRAVTTAPELFAAAIFDVGQLDSVRSEESANGITNISEFGTVKDPKEFAALLEMSTYHQIKDGTAYPAVMLIHGLNDPRVDVWHSAKTAARLQAASRSGKPVLMRLDGQAGHGMGSTAQQSFSKQGDIYSFLLWQFGKMTAAP